MERFTRLYFELDETMRTSQKLAALVRYFSEAPPQDAAWALVFLSGGRLARAVTTPLLRQWISEESAIPLWLVEECWDSVGDLAETLALLLPDNPSRHTSLGLAQLVQERLVPLKQMPEELRRETITKTWRELNTRERFVWNKLICGSFRVGVARTLVIRALAEVAGIEAPVMAHRLMGAWQPSAESYLQLLSAQGDGHSVKEPAKPFPFYLAYQLDVPAEELGEIGQWLVEWKWDGIRAQMIHRDGQVLVWSRGEELVTDRYPELEEVARALPDGTVLDGEILAWREECPLPFGALQRRIGRKRADAKLRAEVPVVFMAYDLLERDWQDQRQKSIEERRRELEEVVQAMPAGLALRLSPLVHGQSWQELAQLQSESRCRQVEGLMLKRRTSSYGVGRQRGNWWKWKIDPYHIDAVMIHAQRGHGKRASLFTDYTFGLWHEGKLIPVAKAYSGLTDAEIREVDAFVKRNTLERFGPVHAVSPKLVFELAFEGIQPSARHKSGVAVRFPRIARWRHDKPAHEADSLDNLRALLNGGGAVKQ